MKKNLFIFYNLAITSLITLVSILNAHSLFETIAAFIYLPLVFYFMKELIHRTRPLIRPVASANTKTDTVKNNQPAGQSSPFPITKEQLRDNSATAPIPERGRVIDNDRRIFLKLIGSAGISVFMLALFTKKAQAAFFGSVPGPGVIAIKDTAGNKIDPAKHHPTAGFKIAQLDDTSSATYAYYGFVDKTGAWYLQREQLTGANAGQYLYSTGASGFSTAWTNRVSPTPTYDTFDNTF